MFHPTVQFSRLSKDFLCQILSSIAFAEQDPYLVRATNRVIKMAYDDGRGVWHLICQGKGLQGLNPNQARQRCNEYLRAPLLEALETLKPGCVGTGSKFMQQGQMYQHLDLSSADMSSLPASISGCVALKELRCNHCHELASLGAIGGCTSLQTLKLWCCEQLESLPAGLVQQLKSQGCTIYR